MSLILAGVLFAAYLANVVTGSVSGTALLGDVGEMLLLFAASVAFVFGILKCEDTAKKNNDR